MEKQKESRHAKLFILLGILVLFILFFDLWSIRALSRTEIDDIHPLMCGENDIDYIQKADVLWVVPLFDNVSIASNMTWCKSILAMNKTLGLHGVYHTYNEFRYPRNESYTLKGIAEFKKCFGFEPTRFKAPQLELGKKNREFLENNSIEIHGFKGQLFHKVYHCNDTGTFSNKFVERF